MTDPLAAALRALAPAPPVDPDPRFATALRARLERALLDLPEEPMTTTLDRAAAREAEARLHTLTPYLAVVDTRAAVDFYVAAFGARRRAEAIVMPGGKVGHVELALGDSVLMLADEFPEMGLAAPVTRGGVSQSLHLEVPDPDAVVAAAVAAGATLERPVIDSPYGRGGVVLDPSGHRWMVSRAAPAAHPGDVVHAALRTPDGARAERFYRAVLGPAAVSGPGGLDLRGDVAPEPATVLRYLVPDVDEAAALVRAAGGTAAEPTDQPHGRLVDCVDDQGLPFALADAGEPAGPAYVELRVPDAGRARAFWSTLLGRRFLPGTEPGYWHPESGRPSSGLVGGYAAAVVVPTFPVADLDLAVAAVDRAGGRVVARLADRHGAGVECVDDQGAVFTLRQEPAPAPVPS